MDFGHAPQGPRSGCPRNRGGGAECGGRIVSAESRAGACSHCSQTVARRPRLPRLRRRGPCSLGKPEKGADTGWDCRRARNERPQDRPCQRRLPPRRTQPSPKGAAGLRRHRLPPEYPPWPVIRRWKRRVSSPRKPALCGGFAGVRGRRGEIGCGACEAGRMARARGVRGNFSGRCGGIPERRAMPPVVRREVGCSCRVSGAGVSPWPRLHARPEERSRRKTRGTKLILREACAWPHGSGKLHGFGGLRKERPRCANEGTAEAQGKLPTKEADHPVVPEPPRCRETAGSRNAGDGTKRPGCRAGGRSR